MGISDLEQSIFLTGDLLFLVVVFTALHFVHLSPFDFFPYKGGLVSQILGLFFYAIIMRAFRLLKARSRPVQYEIQQVGLTLAEAEVEWAN